MLEYALRRLLAAVPLLFGLSLLAFFYVRLIPGDPVVAMLGVNSDPELVAKVREQLGLDRPWWVQYGDWIGGVFQGDLGVAFRSGVSITTILVERIPASVQLAVGGLIVGLLLAIPAGIAAGVRRGSVVDAAVSSASLFGLAIPVFWIGSLLVMLLAVWLHWLPSGGYVPWERDPIKNIRSLILPSITLGIGVAPYLTRLTRATVSEVKRETFVPFARAQGLSRGTISSSIIFRNAAPSLVVAVGVTIGGLLAGSVIVESLFNWPGMGRLMVAAVGERDYAMIQALLLVYGVIFILVNLFAELAQGALDPRIRLE